MGKILKINKRVRTKRRMVRWIGQVRKEIDNKIDGSQ